MTKFSTQRVFTVNLLSIPPSKIYILDVDLDIDVDLDVDVDTYPENKFTVEEFSLKILPVTMSLMAFRNQG